MECCGISWNVVEHSDDSCCALMSNLMSNAVYLLPMLCVHSLPNVYIRAAPLAHVALREFSPSVTLTLCSI